MKEIKEIPDLAWTEQARREIALTGQALLDQSDFAWVIGNLAICGLLYRNFLNPPWFWFALTEGITIRDLIDFRRLKELIPQGALTAVDESFGEGMRFARLYGFEDTGLREAGYHIYRRA